MAIHGEAFLNNIQELIQKLLKGGDQPIQVRVSPDILRKYGKEIAATSRPPLIPGNPPSFFGLPLVQSTTMENGTVMVIVQPKTGGRQEIDLGPIDTKLIN